MVYCCSSGPYYSSRNISDRYGIACENITNKRMKLFKMKYLLI